MAFFRWFYFLILVVRHVIAGNRVRIVLGKDALSMMQLPELLAAGAGYVVDCLSMLRLLKSTGTCCSCPLTINIQTLGS